MQEPSEIAGQVLWEQMSGIYREWARRDRFVGVTALPHAQDAGQVGSVRELVGHVFRAAARRALVRKGAPVKAHLDLTLGELLELEAPAPAGGTHRLMNVFVTAFCDFKVAPLFAEARHSVEAKGGVLSEEVLVAANCQSWELLETRLMVDANRERLTQGLRKIFLEESAGRALWDFYKMPMDDSGYRSWWPKAYTGLGRPLKMRSVTTPHGRVDVQVSRYTEDTGSDITAYEWQATLHAPRSGLVPAEEGAPDAAACGMAYILPRDFGAIQCSTSDLRWAADAVADTDVAQMLAFLQRPDAEERLKCGDLCFLWLWERREGAPKGLGTEVLTVALQDLKKRFGTLRTLVVNLKPSQFVPTVDERDPPEVHIARHEAAEKLEQLLMATTPERHLHGLACLVAPARLSPAETVFKLNDLDTDDGSTLPIRDRRPRP